MPKYYVEVKEILTYNLTVEAEDADAAWDEALKTKKFCESNFDDNDAECASIHEVPQDQIEYAEVDET
jgi:hypothetical protein